MKSKKSTAVEIAANKSDADGGAGPSASMLEVGQPKIEPVLLKVALMETVALLRAENSFGLLGKVELC